jgi:hypothetical protein
VSRQPRRHRLAVVRKAAEVRVPAQARVLKEAQAVKEEAPVAKLKNKNPFLRAGFFIGRSTFPLIIRRLCLDMTIIKGFAYHVRSQSRGKVKKKKHQWCSSGKAFSGGVKEEHNRDYNADYSQPRRLAERMYAGVKSLEAHKPQGCRKNNQAACQQEKTNYYGQ